MWQEYKTITYRIRLPWASAMSNHLFCLVLQSLLLAIRPHSRYHTHSFLPYDSLTIPKWRKSVPDKCISPLNESRIEYDCLEQAREQQYFVLSCKVIYCTTLQHPQVAKYTLKRQIIGEKRVRDQRFMQGSRTSCGTKAQWAQSWGVSSSS